MNLRQTLLSWIAMELALDPVLANPCLILANPLPISGQSKDQLPFNAKTSISLRVDWQCRIAGLPLNWRIGTGLALDWPIGTELANWHRIGRLAPDWLQIGRLALDWHWIGRLAPD